MIVGASVMLSAYFPDEARDQAQALLRDHVVGHRQLTAPTLLLYEVTKAVLQARRRGRINDEQVNDVLASFEGLGIALEPVSWQQMFPLTVRFNRSAYDAAYLALAKGTEQPLITDDARMYNAVREHVEWVQWIGDYPRVE
jgi:predicted nucleic acid-binding protein